MRGSHSKVLQILSKWQCRVSKCSQNAHKVLTEVPFPKSCKYHKHIRFRLQLAARAVEKEGFEVPLVMPYIYIYIFHFFDPSPWEATVATFKGGIPIPLILPEKKLRVLGVQQKVTQTAANTRRNGGHPLEWNIIYKWLIKLIPYV